jgi:hypothetical protein
MSTPLVEAKPYKGPESYQVEDAEVFFGRDEEANQLVAKILSSRFTLVYAQSGAGKTSLINARVIPGLEAKGWSSVRILPQNDPVASIRETCLRYVLPPPIAELSALRRAKDVLVATGEDPTLNELLARYDKVEIRDSRRRLLVMPIEVPWKRPRGLSTELAHVSPLFCRVLRCQIEVEAYVAHLCAIYSSEITGERARISLTGESPLSVFEAKLSSSALSHGYDSLLAEVNVPVTDLCVFFEELTQTYGRRLTRFALVLIIDQFEELFTRFTDAVPIGEKSIHLPHWRLRWELFDQLERLYRTEVSLSEAPGDNVRVPLPIRIVISMRDEYIAQLDPMRRFVDGFDDRCYHLSLLGKGEAASAVSEPASLFGYTYSQKCFSAIVDQLLKEDRFVEPAHLQLVCEKLWNERGRDLAAASARTSEPNESSGPGLQAATNQIELAILTDLGGTKGILSSFFDDFLAQLDSGERLETLEILEPLVTASGTRNILEYDQLVNMPLRDSSRRQELVKKLVNRTIVRTERRLGGYFVEITHEFLIVPILAAIRKDLIGDVDYSRFRWALRTLQRMVGVRLTRRSHLLLEDEFTILHENRDRIRWDAFTTELMFRSAIDLGKVRSILEWWAWKVEECGGMAGSAKEIFAMGFVGHSDTLLSLEELRVINAERDRLELSLQEYLIVLRSQLEWAIDVERDEIAYWARRMVNYAT